MLWSTPKHVATISLVLNHCPPAIKKFRGRVTPLGAHRIRHRLTRGPLSRRPPWRTGPLVCGGTCGPWPCGDPVSPRRSHPPTKFLDGPRAVVEDQADFCHVLWCGSLLKLVLALGFRVEIRDDLTMGLHPFVLRQHTATVCKFLRGQADRYTMVAYGTGPPC